MVALAIIRPAVAADIEACVALAARPTDAPSRLPQDLSDAERFVLVAEVAGRVVGYGRTMRFRPAADAPADCAPAGYYLIGMVVEPAFRRQGIGTALTQARLAWISERATHAWYFANSRNAASIALHSRFGFREVTRAFSFPRVAFEGGEGILFRAKLADAGA